MNTVTQDCGFEEMRVSGYRNLSVSISAVNITSPRFWQIAVLTAAGTLSGMPEANAALYYWQDFDPGYYRPAPSAHSRRQPTRRHSLPKTGAAEKETAAKAHGPLIIAVSIDQQKVRIYDANGFFAASPVSTGMKGHSTPMGVFSVIQKHRLHHSNIYSNAPMPYMQRITWSGVAMHAGVLPGYPASHGCIRMPTAFAVKMWNWTKMGARVIITPGEITPAIFSHPLLVAQKVAPQPMIADQPKSDVSKSDLPKTDEPAVKSDKGADAGSAIKSTSPEALVLRSTVGHASPVATLSPEQTRTADASAAMPSMIAAVTISDARPSTGGRQQASEAATSDFKSADSGATDKDDVAKAAENSAEPAKPGTDVPSTASTDAKKDPARLPGIEKAVAAKPDPPKRTGQIAVFVSRKDSKLYVRQNFAPLFEVPITIAPSDHPLGTHVFTAQADKSDPNLLRWSVVSLPVSARNAARSDDGRSTRRRKMAGEALAELRSPPVQNTPAEALDRITVPPDVMARIADALTTGASIIVSDQGIDQGETGEGTDFIVSLR
jgi:lipoprotein-anchoring transpeptidase ErfK/SrfK